jgi:hypothetical protein
MKDQKKLLYRIEWLLRIGVFACFLGHGYLAICKTPGWFRYLETVGISDKNVEITMVLIGCLDIIVALVTLIKPLKTILLWACFWAFSAALIRPISGDSIWAFVERGANWLAPLALYYVLVLKEKSD